MEVESPPVVTCMRCRTANSREVRTRLPTTPQGVLPPGAQEGNERQPAKHEFLAQGGHEVHQDQRTGIGGAAQEENIKGCLPIECKKAGGGRIDQASQGDQPDPSVARASDASLLQPAKLPEQQQAEENCAQPADGEG